MFFPPEAGVGGAVIGGVAGAVLGNQVGHGHGREAAMHRTESARRPVWRVKVVTPQGEVRVLLIDFATGRAV